MCCGGVPIREGGPNPRGVQIRCDTGQRPEVSIHGAGQMDRSFWGRECGLKRCSGDNTRRKNQEMRLIFELGTLKPNGLNINFSFI